MVVEDDGGEWEFRPVENLTRAKALDDVGAAPAIHTFFRALERKRKKSDPLLGSVADRPRRTLELLAERYQNVIRLSRPTPILAPTAETALDLLFGSVVLDPPRKHRRIQTKTNALTQLNDALAAVQITGQHRALHVELCAGEQREKIDLAVFNGRAVQINQGWSFQVKDLRDIAHDVRAWGYTVDVIRDQGGEVAVSGQHAVEVPTDVEVNVVYAPPTTAAGRSTLKEACAVFENLDVPHGPVDEMAADIGKRARSLLEDAHVEFPPTQAML